MIEIAVGSRRTDPEGASRAAETVDDRAGIHIEVPVPGGDIVRELAEAGDPPFLLPKVLFV